MNTLPLPTVSDELQAILDAFPNDLKPRLTGMSFEQRTFIMAKLICEIHSLHAEDFSDAIVQIGQKCLDEAIQHLINWGKAVIIPTKPEMQAVFEMADHPQMRPLLVDGIMVFPIDWKAILDALKGTEFEMGNNRWRIEGMGDFPGKEGKEAVGVLLTVIGSLEELYDVPTFPIGRQCVAGTHQVETALNRRLV